MNHPLTRIFAPISMIVLVAAFTVATATVDSDDRTPVGEATVATAVTGSDSLQTITASQTSSD